MCISWLCTFQTSCWLKWIFCLIVFALVVNGILSRKYELRNKLVHVNFIKIILDKTYTFLQRQELRGYCQTDKGTTVKDYNRNGWHYILRSCHVDMILKALVFFPLKVPHWVKFSSIQFKPITCLCPVSVMRKVPPWLPLVVPTF